MLLRSAIAAVLGLSMITGARAADLKVLAGGSMTAVLGELGPQFEKATGHKLTIEYGATPQLIKQVASGAPFDLGVVPADLFKDAAAKARFVPDPTVDIARVGYGIVVRAGAARPDIATPDTFKQTLLKAQSIAFLPDSAAGAYVLKVFERLGIADVMKAKTKIQSAPPAPMRRQKRRSLSSAMSRRRFLGSFSRHRVISGRSCAGTLSKLGVSRRTAARVSLTSSPLNGRWPVESS